MKVVILAGGLGTRLSEETDVRPKPMVEIGGKPVLWHIMKIYSHYGFNDFIICLGYKSYLIKEYFHHYSMHLSDVVIDIRNNNIAYINSKAEPWKITLVDTGIATQTGGRIKRIQKYVGNEPFMLTYGDGVSDVNLRELVKYHQTNKKLATLTCVLPRGKFGALNLDDKNNVLTFQEKPDEDGTWINSGFFVLEPKIFDYIKDNDDNVFWEREPLENLALDNQLMAYKHTGFWKPMDTLRDRNELEDMWQTGNALWKVWHG
ncbi:MAG: glucose-1-phosphate cytidylyltransferase [Candidatus Margulisiibacteriota bacterium]|jgi:glucose-1-phosphate cytidylyltransferase